MMLGTPASNSTAVPSGRRSQIGQIHRQRLVAQRLPQLFSEMRRHRSDQAHEDFQRFTQRPFGGIVLYLDAADRVGKLIKPRHGLVEVEGLDVRREAGHGAVRYTPEGGRIELQWRWTPEMGGEISVVDNGPGIAREHLPRITERFYRVDRARSRATGGTGLGLSIVRHVAQNHGGTVLVDSREGEGSTFTLALPVTPS